MSRWLLVAPLLCLGAVAEQPAKPTKPKLKFAPVHISRLTFDDDGVCYFNLKVKAKNPADPAGPMVEHISVARFGGIAYWEGDNWRAEVTFDRGIPHGEVIVIVNNTIFSRFRYDQGRKIVD